MSNVYQTNEVYRAVVIIKQAQSVPVKYFIGPYFKGGTAKAMVTRVRNGHSRFRKSDFIDGWIEVARDWERTE